MSCMQSDFLQPMTARSGIWRQGDTQPPFWIMLFRLLLIVLIFYLLRSLVLYFLDRAKRPGSVQGRAGREELDLSKYEIEDVEYRDLEDD